MSFCNGLTYKALSDKVAMLKAIMPLKKNENASTKLYLLPLQRLWFRKQEVCASKRPRRANSEEAQQEVCVSEQAMARSVHRKGQ
jgi:hypothetical protein